jgi:hypothetical protein
MNEQTDKLLKSMDGWLSEKLDELMKLMDE